MIDYLHSKFAWIAIVCLMVVWFVGKLNHFSLPPQILILLRHFGAIRQTSSFVPRSASFLFVNAHLCTTSKQIPLKQFQLQWHNKRRKKISFFSLKNFKSFELSKNKINFEEKNVTQWFIRDDRLILSGMPLDRECQFIWQQCW